jgi:hypothetical protein
MTELKSFDLDVVKKWNDLIGMQAETLGELGIPYFTRDMESEKENREKILAFLEDLITEERQ